MTTSTSLNRSFALRARSSERNLLTACDLDSLICFADGFLGSGATNLPSLECEWFDSSAVPPSVLPWAEPSAPLAALPKTSEDVVSGHDCAVESGVTQACADEPKLPYSTQPNSVSRAVGESGGPLRQPRRSTSTNTSTPSSRSMRQGCPNPGSARGRSARCFQFSW